MDKTNKRPSQNNKKKGYNNQKNRNENVNKKQQNQSFASNQTKKEFKKELVKKEEIKEIPLEKIKENKEVEKLTINNEKLKDNNESLKIVIAVLCVAVVALIAFLAIRVKNEAKDISNVTPGADVEAQKDDIRVPADLGANDEYPNKIDKFTNDGVYENLGYILNNVFLNRKYTGYNSLKDALTMNDNMLGIVDFKTEFAFQYALSHNYMDISASDDTYVMSREDYAKIYNDVYVEELDDSINSFLKDGNYVSNRISGNYSENTYRFVQMDERLDKDELISMEEFTTVASVYDSISDCKAYSQDQDSNYCYNHGKKIGSVKIKYAKDGDRFIIRTLSLFTK